VRGNDAGGGALWDADFTRNNIDLSNNEDYNITTNRGWRFLPVRYLNIDWVETKNKTEENIINFELLSGSNINPVISIDTTKIFAINNILNLDHTEEKGFAAQIINIEYLSGTDTNVFDKINVDFSNTLNISQNINIDLPKISDFNNIFNIEWYFRPSSAQQSWILGERSTIWILD